MSQPRFLSRLPGACYQGRASLREYQLRFHKSGRDGSAKADALLTGQYHDQVHGVLYQITEDEKRLLDHIEDCGIGYEVKDIEVIDESGGLLPAFTYVALHIDRSMRPYHWYKEHVLHGAKAASLPEKYIRYIKHYNVVIDNDISRIERELSVYGKGL